MISVEEARVISESYKDEDFERETEEIDITIKNAAKTGRKDIAVSMLSDKMIKFLQGNGYKVVRKGSKIINCYFIVSW